MRINQPHKGREYSQERYCTFLNSLMQKKNQDHKNDISQLFDSRFISIQNNAIIQQTYDIYV